MRTEETYTMKEISVASGINVATLNSRRKRMGMEAPKDGEGYTLDIAVAPLRYAQARPARANPSDSSAALPPLPLIAVAPMRCAQARPARANPSDSSAALPPLPLCGVAAVRNAE